MTQREEIRAAVESGDLETLDALTAKNPRSLRYLVGVMYQPDEGLRRVGARAIALAARHHPKMVEKIITRVVWAMSVESNTYAPTAPEVLLAIADEKPELLLPVAADLIRLSKDESLHEGLGDTLRRLGERCPGRVGRELTKSLNRDLKEGGCFTGRDTRRR